MPKICQFTGVRPKSGHKVSYSNHKTNRRFIPNLIKKTFLDEKTGQRVELLITARALRSYTKNPKKFAEQIHNRAKKDLKKKFK